MWHRRGDSGAEPSPPCARTLKEGGGGGARGVLQSVLRLSRGKTEKQSKENGAFYVVFLSFFVCLFFSFLNMREICAT